MRLKFNLLTAAALIALPVSAGAQDASQPDPQVPPPVEESVAEPAATQPQPTEESQPEASEAIQQPQTSAPIATPPAEADTVPPAEDSSTETTDQTEAPPPAQAQANSAATAQAAAGPVTPVTAADVRAGLAVVDTQGGAVGTIESVDAEGAVVATGEVRAKLPLTSFGKNNLGLVISMTKAQLEAAAQAQTPSQ